MTEVRKISPSQITLYRSCPRKWAFAYVQGAREASTPAQALGVAVHKILEDYVRDGKLIDGTSFPGAIAQSATPFLPPVKTGSVEGNFEIPYDGFSLAGFFDWSGRDTFAPGPNVTDYKTCKTFQYARKADDPAENPDSLLIDPQSILYSRAVLDDENSVAVRFLYLRTSEKESRKARPVDFSLSRTSILVGTDNLAAEAEVLVRLRHNKTDPLTLPPNPKACFKYNRLCEHSQKCNLTLLETMSSMQPPIGKDSLMAGLKAKAMGQVAPTVPSTPSGPLPIPGSAPAPVGLPLPGSVPPPPPAPPPPAIVAPPGFTAEQFQQFLAYQAASQAGQVTPPPPMAPPQEFPAPIPAASVAPITPVAHLAQQAPEYPPLVAPPPPAKRPPGRPPGAKNKPKDPPYTNPPTFVATPSQAQAIAAPVAPAINGVPHVEPDTKKYLGTLYVNCLPVGGSVEFSNFFYGPANLRIQNELGFADYRMIEFGKGPGLFAALISEAIKESGGGYDLFVDSRTPEGSAVLETLTGLAENVIRGI